MKNVNFNLLKFKAGYIVFATIAVATVGNATKSFYMDDEDVAKEIVNFVKTVFDAAQDKDDVPEIEAGENVIEGGGVVRVSFSDDTEFYLTRGVESIGDANDIAHFLDSAFELAQKEE